MNLLVGSGRKTSAPGSSIRPKQEGFSTGGILGEWRMPKRSENIQCGGAIPYSKRIPAPSRAPDWRWLIHKGCQLREELGRYRSPLRILQGYRGVHRDERYSEYA